MRCACCLQFGLDLLGGAATIESLQFVGRVSGDVFNEVVDLSASVVLDGLRFAILGQPEECRESAHLELWWHIVGGGVHLDDSDFLVLQLGAKLLEDGSEFLAVSAPWSVELDQRVLVVVDNHIVEVLADSNDDRAVVGSGDLFGLDVGFKSASVQVSQELGEAFDAANFKKNVSLCHKLSKIHQI